MSLHTYLHLPLQYNFSLFIDEAELANAVSRSGDVKEALGGPFLYVTTITTAIFVFWRSTLPGIIAVSTMAAGDGVSNGVRINIITSQSVFSLSRFLFVDGRHRWTTLW